MQSPRKYLLRKTQGWQPAKAIDRCVFDVIDLLVPTCPDVDIDQGERKGEELHGSTVSAQAGRG